MISTCHGAWESACLWTLLAGCTTCTARASSTETSPPRYRVSMLLHLKHIYSHAEHWNSPPSSRCWVIEKMETVIMCSDKPFPCRTVWSAVKTAHSLLWWATLAWLKRSPITGQWDETLRPVSAIPSWKNYTDQAWCHSDVIQPEDTVSCTAATRLVSFLRVVMQSVYSSPPCCKS